MVVFFGNNPDTGRTLAAAAHHLHRSVSASTKELDGLTYLRVLVCHDTPERTTYRLPRRATVRHAAIRLAQLDDRSGNVTLR